jgi:hypothetical protein
LRVFRRRQQDVQQRALAEGKAQPHRWAPDQRYVTAIVHDAQNLDSTMEPSAYLTGILRVSATLRKTMPKFGEASTAFDPLVEFL